jgi:hypothetical protein
VCRTGVFKELQIGVLTVREESGAVCLPFVENLVFTLIPDKGVVIKQLLGYIYLCGYIMLVIRLACGSKDALEIDIYYSMYIQ